MVEHRLRFADGKTQQRTKHLLSIWVDRQILLDPRNIQMLLAFGGALMVVGLVILLYVNDIFTPQVVALTLGISNAALLGVGWWTLRRTRYQPVGRAFTLLACLVMPLTLWYYNANNPFGNQFILGANTAAETQPGYLRGPSCGSAAPVTFASIAFPDAHIVLTATGAQ